MNTILPAVPGAMLRRGGRDILAFRSIYCAAIVSVGCGRLSEGRERLPTEPCKSSDVIFQKSYSYVVCLLLIDMNIHVQY